VLDAPAASATTPSTFPVTPPSRTRAFAAGAAGALGLTSPAHDRFDECFDCEILHAARDILLARSGSLTPAESTALTAAVLAGTIEGHC
jgi:hypothetical protein